LNDWTPPVDFVDSEYGDYWQLNNTRQAKYNKPKHGASHRRSQDFMTRCMRVC